MDDPVEPHPTIKSVYLEAAISLWGKAGKLTVLPVHGYSMAPLFQEGDQILLEYSPLRVRIGDILVFRQGDQMVVHRVLRILRNSSSTSIWIAKGDNNLCIDPPVNPEQVVGRVVIIWRSGCAKQLDRLSWRVTGYAAAAVGRAAILALGLLHINPWANRHSRVMTFIYTLPVRLRLFLL